MILTANHDSIMIRSVDGKSVNDVCLCWREIVPALIPWGDSFDEWRKHQGTRARTTKPTFLVLSLLSCNEAGKCWFSPHLKLQTVQLLGFCQSRNICNSQSGTPKGKKTYVNQVIMHLLPLSMDATSATSTWWYSQAKWCDFSID